MKSVIAWCSHECIHLIFIQNLLFKIFFILDGTIWVYDIGDFLPDWCKTNSTFSFFQFIHSFNFLLIVYLWIRTYEWLKKSCSSSFWLIICLIIIWFSYWGCNWWLHCLSNWFWWCSWKGHWFWFWLEHRFTITW